MNIFASKFLFDLIDESLTSDDHADKVETESRLCKLMMWSEKKRNQNSEEKLNTNSKKNFSRSNCSGLNSTKVVFNYYLYAVQLACILICLSLSASGELFRFGWVYLYCTLPCTRGTKNTGCICMLFAVAVSIHMFW